jgi:hypothetical protein
LIGLNDGHGGLTDFALAYGRSRTAASFFFGVPNLPQLRDPHVVRENNLKVASLLDLAGTKASVVQVRAEAKDYEDMDALIRIGKVSLPTSLAAAKGLYGPGFNPEVSRGALASTWFADRHPWCRMPSPANSLGWFHAAT